MNNLTTYECIGNPNVHTTKSIAEIFGIIKNNPDKDLFKVARDYKKKSLDNPEDATLSDRYRNLKNKFFPTVCFNSNIDKLRNTQNYLSSTGIMYIDVDKDGFDINLLDKHKVFSYYHSIGGIGYGILVKVDGLTLENYESTFNYIINDLNLTNYYDKGAKGMVQQTVISYDPNIYVNKASYVFQSINDNNFTPLSIVNKEKDIYQSVGGKIVYNNNSSYNLGIKPNQYVSDWVNGFEQIRAWIPYSKKVQDGNRYKTLISYGTNFLYLNQHLDFYGIFNNLKHVNLIACENPMDEKQLVKIAKALIKQRSEGGLRPIKSKKKRKVIFAENSTLDKAEKLQIVNRESSIAWRKTSLSKILGIIESWDFPCLGKITQSSLVKHHAISKKTVEKYWAVHKEYIAALNNEFYKKENMKLIPKKDYINLSEIDLLKNNKKVTGVPSIAEQKVVNNSEIKLPEPLSYNNGALRFVTKKGDAMMLENGSNYTGDVVEQLLKKYNKNQPAFFVNGIVFKQNNGFVSEIQRSSQ